MSHLSDTSKNESIQLLEHYLCLMATDKNWRPEPERLIELRPAFAEECAKALVESVNRFEMQPEMVQAYLDLYDAYVIALHEIWVKGECIIDYDLPEIETFFERVAESYMNLKDLHEASGNPAEFSATITLINHGPLECGDRDCTLAIFTPSVAGDVLRDKFSASLPSAVLGAALADSFEANFGYLCEPRSANQQMDFYSKALH